MEKITCDECDVVLSNMKIFLYFKSKIQWKYAHLTDRNVNLHVSKSPTPMVIVCPVYRSSVKNRFYRFKNRLVVVIFIHTGYFERTRP